MTCDLFLILYHVLCVLAIDPGTSTECTETPVCDESGRYRSLTERDDYIENVETLLMEENERNDLLEKNLHEVETMKASLEETITSHEIDFVKVNDALELSLEIKHDLLDKIAKLKV